MKALVLTNEYPPHVYGGAGVHVDYLTRELARLIDVEVRCFGDQAATTGALQVTGYDIDAARFATTNPQLRSPLQALSRCIDFTATPIDADVVHCHTWYSHFGGIVAKLAYGIPLVITTHSLEPSRAWKRDQLGRGYDLSAWIERTALSMADRVIAVSKEMQADIVRLFDVPVDRLRVVYNGIDTDEYHRVATTATLTQYGVDPTRPYVLFVGRLTRQKGIIHLVHAIPHLRPDTQVVLCAGLPDTKEIEQEMTAAVQRVQQHRPHVVWIREMVERRAAIELYSHAAVFCCPSIYEPFGIINLEAMACEVPVVASAVGGIKEVVVDGTTGILVPVAQHPSGEPKDPDQFARDLAVAINGLLVDSALRRRMGTGGRERAVRSFGWSAIARQVIEIYASLND